MVRSREMAKILGVSHQTLLQMVHANQVPLLKLPSGHFRFDPEEVVAFLKKDGSGVVANA